MFLKSCASAIGLADPLYSGVLWQVAKYQMIGRWPISIKKDPNPTQQITDQFLLPQYLAR